MLWLNIFSPLRYVSEETDNLKGLILVAAPVGEAFVQKVSEFTGTHVNLFLGSNLSVEDLKGYVRLGGEAQTVTSDTDDAGIDQKTALLRDFSTAGQSFFEGLFPL